MRRQYAKALLLVACVVVAVAPGPAVTQEMPVATEPEIRQAPTHMPEDVRASVSKIVILATEGGSGEAVTGTYGKKTPGFLGGMEEGSKIGHIPVEVGGVPIGIPIPILREIGMIAGAISGKTKREIQEFRDRLTEDLKSVVDQPLTNDSLANDVFWGLKNVPTLEPRIFALTTPLPPDTEAILYVALTDLSINVQGREAIITTTATARLDRASDGTTLYRKEVKYQDQDTLSNWIDDDTKLWREYRNFARHYIGREIAAELYERVTLDHELVPTESDTVRPARNKDWLAESKSLNPTLAWDLTLSGDDAWVDWAGDIDVSTITWDLEIYDLRRPVYSAKQISGSAHTVGAQLEACKVYRWSVRPTYSVGGVRKKGAWMRLQPQAAVGNGNVGRAASVAHAYIQDFASFKVSCRLK